jgi:hypothetical protein
MTLFSIQRIKKIYKMCYISKSFIWFDFDQTSGYILGKLLKNTTMSIRPDLEDQSDNK